MVMDNNLSPSLFAGRYQFIKPTDTDWDIGRSGIAQPAIDTQTNKLIVIKHTDPTSPHADRHEHSLQNEAKALKALIGEGVPDLYTDNQADYGSSRRFTYLVIEYISGIRVEKDLFSLKPIEHAYIITELIRLLAIAHAQGIVNGDVDLKHLFWRRENKQLVVIDWGNASLGVDKQKNGLFAYDLARCAEIIYALVTKRGIAHPTGSLSLSSGLIPDISPLPDEFYTLCEWAPRNPSEEVHIPFTALSLYLAAKKWLVQLDPTYSPDDSWISRLSASKLMQPPAPPPQIRRSGVIPIIIGILLVGLTLLGIVLFESKVNVSNITTNESTIPTLTPTETVTFKSEPTSAFLGTITPIPTATATIAITVSPFTIPSSRTYSAPISLDAACLKIGFPTPTPMPAGIQYRDDKIWQFDIGDGYVSTYKVETDFEHCQGISLQSVEAISLYIWVNKIAPRSEFGFFLEYEDGQRREYTIWADENNTLYLRFRENNAITDYELLLISPSRIQGSLQIYYQYSALMFLEIDNKRANILYLNPGLGFDTTLKAENIIPSQMIRMDNVTRTIPNGLTLKRFGLIGYGPNVQVLLLPLSFYDNDNP